MALMMQYHIPVETDLLAFIGIVALRHAHLTHQLRMTIKVIDNLTVQLALDSTLRDSFSAFHQAIKKKARKRIGDCPAYRQLCALLTCCARATDLRNEYIHSVWAQTPEGQTFLKGYHQELQPIPTLEQVKTLAQQLEISRNS